MKRAAGTVEHVVETGHRPVLAAATIALTVATIIAPGRSTAVAAPPAVAEQEESRAGEAMFDALGAFRWRNIGPANMMGRIADIDALDTDYRVVLVGSASGGVFLSKNAGITWDPIFDSARGAGSIGAVALFQADPDVIWVGTGEAANRNSTGWGDGVYRTTDGGETWSHVGLEDTNHIASIATHPTNPDLAYVAAPGHLWGYSGDRGLYRTTNGGATWAKLAGGLPDDGKVQVTRDGGVSWADATPNLVRDADRIARPIWVSRVEASHHDAGTAYVSLDDHRRDDMRPFVLETRDFGETWTDISSDLPGNGSVYVVVEDRIKADLLFVGTEFGVFTSTDRGGSWGPLDNNLPVVAAYDLLVHPRDQDLVVGTHGRSIWIADDISALQQLDDDVRASDLHLFESRVATRWVRENRGRKQQFFLFRGENPPPGALIHFWLGAEAAAESSEPGRGVDEAESAAVSAKARIDVEEVFGDRSAKIEVDAHAGINRAVWDLTFSPTVGERREYAARMEDVIETLRGRVEKADLLAKLDEIEATLVAIDLDPPPVSADEAAEPASGERVFVWMRRSRDPVMRVVSALNGVRSAVVEDFALYAYGRPLFGPKLEPTAAAAGRYRVRVTVGGRVVEGTVTVREDPLTASSARHDVIPEYR